MLTDGTLTLQKEDLGSILLTPPEDYSGDISLALEARVEDSARRTGDLVVQIEAEADMPNLQIEEACYKEEDEFVRIHFESSLKDGDGSEVLQVYLNDLPQVYRISEEAGSIDIIENGTYTLNYATIEAGYVNVFPSGDYQEFDFHLEAVTHETSNSDRAFTTVMIHVEACTDSTGYCASQPCLNGGSCYNDLGMFVCKCTAQFTGTRCETPSSGTLPPVSMATRCKSTLLSLVSILLLITFQ